MKISAVMVCEAASVYISSQLLDDDVQIPFRMSLLIHISINHVTAKHVKMTALLGVVYCAIGAPALCAGNFPTRY